MADEVFLLELGRPYVDGERVWIRGKVRVLEGDSQTFVDVEVEVPFRDQQTVADLLKDMHEDARLTLGKALTICTNVGRLIPLEQQS